MAQIKKVAIKRCNAVVVVDQRAPKLRAGALAESAIVFYDRDVVVDKPVGMLSVAYEPGNKDTPSSAWFIAWTRTRAA